MTGIAGLILFALASLIVMQGFAGWHASFAGPGSASFAIPEPGDYRLWHESSTVIDGRLQVVEDELPDGAVVEFKDARGNTVPLQAQQSSMTQEIGDTRRLALGRIEIPEAGNYTVTIRGFEDARKFRLSEIRFFEHFLYALLLALPGTLLFIIGVAWATVVAARRA